MKKNVAVFVSGSGSLLPGFFAKEAADASFNVSCIVADRDCLALEKATAADKPSFIHSDFGPELKDFLLEHNVELICLAGYLKIIPAEFIEWFPGLIINTHPSLLPKYKGMYKEQVHKAVIENGDSEAGFTIHEVVPEVDAGRILKQIKLSVEPNDDAKSIEKRLIALEKDEYAEVAAEILAKL